MNITLDLSASMPRLFAAGYRASAQAHHKTFGPLPNIDARALIQEIDLSGLDGRGGAGFALFRKLMSTERGKNTVVIANAAEGEYLSYKDRMLLEHAPHLVLDGLMIAGLLVGSKNLYLYAREESLARMGDLAIQRGISVVGAPGTFVSGEASAAANAVLNGLAKPMNHFSHLNRSERVDGSMFSKKRGPVVVQNVETLAHLALIARYGAQWFRSTGGVGTRLFTVHDRSKGRAAVLELPDGTSLASVAAQAGVLLDDAPAVLVGGLQGAWALPHSQQGQPSPQSISGYDAPLCQGGLPPAAGIIYPLKNTECPLQVSAHFLAFLAAESAGQCGPCVNGLPELAATFSQIATAQNLSTSRVQSELQRLGNLVSGRGMCKHPDATAAFAYRTLQVFGSETEAHRTGKCSRYLVQQSA